MPEFYMLSGTVSSAKKLHEIEALLLKAGLQSEIFEDESNLKEMQISYFDQDLIMNI